MSGARSIRIGLAVLLAAAPLFARGGWEDPPGGWDYIFEADAGQDAYVAGDDVVGLLDGTWAQSGDSSRWDGSAPGVVDTTTDADADDLLDGASPGGLEIVTLPGLGEGGGDASVLSIEDTGNPTAADYLWNGEILTWEDPSNRKIYLYHAVQGDSDDGWTLITRFRLNPQPKDVNVEAGPNGQATHSSGKGHVSIVDKGEGNLSLALNDTNELEIAGSTTTIPIDDPTVFVSVWAVAQEVADQTFAVRIYLDGGPLPTFEGTLVLPDGTEAGAPDDYIAIGLPITDEDGAIQIDYVGFKSGAYDPGVSIPGPSGLACALDLSAEPPVVDLTWNDVGTYESILVRRDGETLATLAGDAEAYQDTPSRSGNLSYEIVAKAGANEWVLGPCPVNFFPIKPWAVPAGGWDYIFDAEAHDPLTNRLDLYNPTAGAPGNLDGEWARASDSDRWDGSSPGLVDTATDQDSDGLLDGPSPGGLAIDRVTGAGPCGEDVQVISIEDCGDPSAADFDWNGEVKQWEDPSNRKIFLGYDTKVTGVSLLDEGVTFAARWRLNPDPIDLASGPDGSDFHKEMGQVGIGYAGEGDAPAANVSFCFSTAGVLRASGDWFSIDIDPTVLLGVWVTVEASETPGEHDVTIYLNGDADPIFAGSVVLPAGAETSFGASVVNELFLGSPESSDDTALQIDWIAWKRGIHAPVAGACGAGDRFRRGDVDGDGIIAIGDAVNLLNYMFASGRTPPCLDAADIDDDGFLVIGDAVSLLNYQFASGRPPAPPGPTECGVDPTDDAFGTCSHASCE
ncbi:MAG: hypothetical protein JXP34_24770 [Planctomycetes bacterium]|nr:hypothetical protein [Planctomycetota bacterium]